MTAIAIFVGIDIAKADFVVACRPDGTSWTAPNGQADCVGRSGAGPGRALHRRASCCATQHGHQSVLSSPHRCRYTQEGRTHRMHAQTPDDPQRDDADEHDVAGDRSTRERLVALKILPEDLVADPDRRRRFEQEAQASSALEHPNIAVIHYFLTSPSCRRAHIDTVTYVCQCGRDGRGHDDHATAPGAAEH